MARINQSCLEDETYENTYGIASALNERKEAFDFLVGLCIVLRIITILKQIIAFYFILFQFILFGEKMFDGYHSCSWYERIPRFFTLANNWHSHSYVEPPLHRSVSSFLSNPEIY